MFNWQTGKWNPSRDNFRYDDSNSITVMDMMTSGAGIRRFMMGGQAPWFLRASGKVGEGLYRGTRKGYQWKKKIDRKIEKSLKNVDKSRIGKLPDRKMKVANKLRKAGRIANTRKGRAGLTTAGVLMSGSSQPEHHSMTDSEDNFIYRQKKEKKRLWLR